MARQVGRRAADGDRRFLDARHRADLSDRRQRQDRRMQLALHRLGWEVSGFRAGRPAGGTAARSEEHTSELQSLMRTSCAVFCLKQKKHTMTTNLKQLTDN